MTTNRFRVTDEHDPTSLWRDIVVGADRPLGEFQTVLNHAVGLNQDHCWCFGTDQDDWDSASQYKRSREIEQSASGLMRGGAEYDAGETTIGQMARQLNRDERDHLCYLFDDSNEWRFDAIRTDVSGRPCTRWSLSAMGDVPVLSTLF